MIKQLLIEDFCLKCKGCCRFWQQDSAWGPCLLDTENIPQAAVNHNRRLRLIENPQDVNFLCPFLNTIDNKCRIYNFRPFECQLYPFLISRDKEKVFLSVDLGCLFAKEKLESQEFKDYLQYLVTYLNSPIELTIIRNNPQIIQSYEGAKILAELDIRK